MREQLNECDSQGFNCLYYAVYHGHNDVVKLLKSVGIEYKKDSKGTSVLHVAIMRGHDHIVRFLLSRTQKIDDLQHQNTLANSKNKEAELKKQQM